MWSEFRGDCAASREKSRHSRTRRGGPDGSEILEASSSQAEEW